MIQDSNPPQKGAQRIWFVRAGSAGSALRTFIDEGFVGVSWSETGALVSGLTLREIEHRLAVVFPARSRRTLTAWAAMLRGFATTMRRGDRVMTIDPATRLYWVGEITSGYIWKAGAQFPHRRAVVWGGTVARSALTDATLRCLGAISTVFRLSASASAEVLAQLHKTRPPLARSATQRPRDATNA